MLVILAAVVGAGPAGAQSAPSTGPAPGHYGAPEWLPLRRNVSGSEIKIGCTYNSRGSQFGYECAGHHDRWAIDFIADAGTPVYAAGPGFATNGTGQGGSSGYGNVVKVEHGLGVQTIYAHLSKVLVPAAGMWVDQSIEIGLVGSTGSSSANHLHFEKRVAGASGPVDPGPLKACALGVQVSYPAVRGVASWYGVPWGSFTLFSDGTTCPTVAQAKAAAGIGGGELELRLPSRVLLYAVATVGRTASGLIAS